MERFAKRGGNQPKSSTEPAPPPEDAIADPTKLPSIKARQRIRNTLRTLTIIRRPPGGEIPERQACSFPIVCNCCQRQLDEPGALLFGPPQLGLFGQVDKYHICKPCYINLRQTIKIR